VRVSVRAIRVRWCDLPFGNRTISRLNPMYSEKATSDSTPRSKHRHVLSFIHRHMQHTYKTAQEPSKDMKLLGSWDEINSNLLLTA